MNLVPPSSRFFFNSGPKKVLSLSPNVKCDQQTHKRMMSPIMASISRKSSNKVPIIIFQMLLELGDEPIITEHFFNGFKGVFMGSIMGSQNVWVRIMGVTLVRFPVGMDDRSKPLVGIYSLLNTHLLSLCSLPSKKGHESDSSRRLCCPAVARQPSDPR